MFLFPIPLKGCYQGLFMYIYYLHRGYWWGLPFVLSAMLTLYVCFDDNIRCEEMWDSSKQLTWRRFWVPPFKFLTEKDPSKKCSFWKGTFDPFKVPTFCFKVFIIIVFVVIICQILEFWLHHKCIPPFHICQWVNFDWRWALLILLHFSTPILMSTTFCQWNNWTDL